jgi:hypothetical protein
MTQSVNAAPDQLSVATCASMNEIEVENVALKEIVTAQKTRHFGLGRQLIDFGEACPR